MKGCHGVSLCVLELFGCRGQAEREFKVEVEAIGKVRHKNLVGLVGYCVDGNKRYILVTLAGVCRPFLCFIPSDKLIANIVLFHQNACI